VRVWRHTHTHTESSIQVRTDAGVDKYALTFDIPSNRKGWLLLAGGGLCRDKFPKLPRSLAIMSAISGDGVGYRHEGNLKRRTGGINTTSTNLRRRLGDACVFFFHVTDTHPLRLALWESGLLTPLFVSFATTV